MRPARLIRTDDLAPLLAPDVAGVFADAESIPTLQAKVAEFQNQISTAMAEADQILASIDADGRDSTPEETTRINELHANIDKLEREIEQRQGQISRAARFSAPQGRESESAPAPEDQRVSAAGATALRSFSAAVASPGRLQTQHVDRGALEMWGWESRSDFMRAVYQARGGKIHDLLQRKAAVNTEIGEHGAFAVPPAISNEILTKVFQEAQLASKCDVVPTSSDRYIGVIDEDEPWSNQGVKVEWIGQRKQIAASTPSLGEFEMKLNKLAGLVQFSNESLADIAQIDNFIRTKVPAKLAEELDNVVLNGTGVNQPLGLLNSPSLLLVAKETTGFGAGGTDPQAAGSIVYKNIRKIWTRVYAPCRRPGTQWVANPDVEEILFDLEFPGDKRPIYIAGNSLAGQPNSTLMGREIYWSQHAPALGKPGDLSYVDPSQYLLVKKVGANPRIDTSMHVLFDYDMSSYRFIIRVGGQPKWKKTVDQKNSSIDRSCFVTVAERA